MGGLLKPNGPWKPVRLVLDRLRRLSRSERPKLLYDGRHPPGSGDQWPAVAQGLVGREELAQGKWEGQLGLGVSSWQGYRMYLQGFHSQFFSFIYLFGKMPYQQRKRSPLLHDRQSFWLTCQSVHNLPIIHKNDIQQVSWSNGNKVSVEKHGSAFTSAA